MNKFHTYFGQVITDTELNEMLSELTGGIERFVQDFGYFGIAAGAVVTRHEPANMTVDVSGPAIIYDQLAQRLSFGSTQVVNCSQDENGVSTAVVGPSNARWLSIFAKFVSTPSDPRTDDLGATVFYRDLAGFQLRVSQGSEADAIADSPRAPLRSDQVLLADVRIVYGQVSIQSVDLDVSRTQTIYRLSGSPISIQARGLSSVLQAMLDALNTVRDGVDADFVAFQATVDAALAAMLATNEAAYLRTAFTDVANTFARGQVINSDSYETPILATTVEPGLDGWRLQMRFPNGSGVVTRIYTGGIDGMFMISTNARWHAGSWVADEFGLASLAAIWNIDEVRIVRRDAYESGFNTSAPGDSTLKVGKIRVTHDVQASTLEATGIEADSVTADAVTADDVTVTNDLHAGGLYATTLIQSNANVEASAFRLRTPVLKTYAIPLAGQAGGVHGPDGTVATNVGLDWILFPLRLPAGVLHGRIEIAHFQSYVSSGGVPCSFQLMRRTRSWSTAGAFSVLEPVGAADIGSSGDGHNLTDITPGGSFNPAYEYVVQWKPGAYPAFVDALRMVDLTDYGPGN